MGSLFNPPRAPAAPPPPPNPQQAAKADSAIGAGSTAMKDQAGGTLLTSPTGAPEVKTGSKQLMGQ